MACKVRDCLLEKLRCKILCKCSKISWLTNQYYPYVCIESDLGSHRFSTALLFPMRVTITKTHVIQILFENEKKEC